ncbi:MAG: DUF488 family protein [Gemmataceae bacterium]
MLLTVGHSNQPFDAFLALLRDAGVTAVADVRSGPYSRYTPQFNREPLAAALRAAGFSYVYLGTELGARRDEPECYDGDTARYDLIAAAPAFRRGLARVRDGVTRHRVALMCAEKEPLDCHRFALVCRHLRDLPIHHLLAGGRLEPHAEAEERLLARLGLPPGDLFRSRDELVEEAYDIHGRRIAYTRAAEDDTD